MKTGNSAPTRRLDLSGIKGWLYLLPAFAFWAFSWSIR